MTKYREILRLTALGLSQRNIVQSIGVSQKTVVKVQKRAREMHLSWPLDETLTDAALETLMFPKESKVSNQKRMLDFNYIQKELLRNGFNKKLLWTEYLEECRQSGDEPLMYSQFCYYIQQDEQKRRATMHINRKPGEQIEVDWAGDPAQITDPDTGEIIPAFLFVGVMTYSQYPYVEAFINEKQRSWITAHVHMYEYFGGVTRILVPDNTTTAVIHNNDWYNQELNTIYHEMAEHYNTAIIPARIRAPKDKPNVEGSVGVISTWITAALRNEQFFSLAELNKAIRRKLEEFVKCVQTDDGTLDYRGFNITKEVMLDLAEKVTGERELPGFSQTVICDEEITCYLRPLHELVMNGSLEFGKEENLLLMLSLLIQRYGQPFEECIPECREEIEQACVFMEKHFTERIYLDQICRYAGLSKSTLLRAFTKSKGVTPYCYLENIRIGAAKKLLEQGVAPVEAALQTGFSDQSHFTNYFNRFIGLAPGVYREIFLKSDWAGGEQHGE